MNILSFIATTRNIIGLFTETVHDSNTSRWIMDMDVDRQTGKHVLQVLRTGLRFC